MRATQELELQEGLGLACLQHPGLPSGLWNDLLDLGHLTQWANGSYPADPWPSSAGRWLAEVQRVARSAGWAPSEKHGLAAPSRAWLDEQCPVDLCWCQPSAMEYRLLAAARATGPL